MATKNETTISGKRYRLCHEYGIWVCENGWSAFRRTENTYMTCGYGKKWFNPNIDANGNRVVRTWADGIVRMDYMVAVCFCPPCHNGGFMYELSHRDGNPANCFYKNLEWKPVKPEKDSKTGLMKVRLFENDEYWVYEDGTIRCGTSPLSVGNYFYDSDMGCTYITDPFVSIKRMGANRTSVDSLMRAAGFVQGNRGSLQSPVILHKDMNYLNCSGDNLEWVESGDQRYRDYLKQKELDKKTLYEDINKGNTHPDWSYWSKPSIPCN